MSSSSTGPALDSRRGPDRPARKLAQVEDHGLPLIVAPLLPVAAVGLSHRTDARGLGVLRAALAGDAYAYAAGEQRGAAEEREGGAGVAAVASAYGFDGVVNHGQVDVSNSMSARQLSSSGSCCGPTVPMLELSHAEGSSGAGGVLVTLSVVPYLPVLSCQQLPVVPRYWSHQKSVRPVGHVARAVRLDNALLGGPAHHVAVELVPVRGRGRYRGRVAAGELRRVDSRRVRRRPGRAPRTPSCRAASCPRSGCCERCCRCRRRSTGRCRREPGRSRHRRRVRLRGTD